VEHRARRLGLGRGKEGRYACWYISCKNNACLGWRDYGELVTEVVRYAAHIVAIALTKVDSYSGVVKSLVT